MEFCNNRIILASASPRRRELLEKFSLPFEIFPAQGKEDAPGNMTPQEYVCQLARQKADEVSAAVHDEAAVFIAADTVVEKDGEILGKPACKEEAEKMLQKLSGACHCVWSGVCVRKGNEVITAAEKTDVYFRKLSQAEIQAYVATGEPLDKAGAYGYQGLAGIFVEKIEGDYFNVIGLPMCLLNKMISQFGITLLG